MPVHERAPDREQLFRYLVGALPADEAERLDELSIANDEFAAQLIAAEADLIDAYVGGELSGDLLEHFRMQYLSSAAKGEKIRFAETLLAYQQRAPASSSAPRRSFLGWFTLSYLVPRWGLAVAALVLAAGVYLMLDNLRLRTEIAAERNALQAREQQLRRELNEQRTTNAAAAKELAAVRESLARLEERSTAAGRGDRTSVLSFMLLAPRRAAGELTTLALPRGVQEVRMQLELESVDFPAYQIALRDPAADGILWRSGRLEAPATRARSFLSITIPADLLGQRTYSLEVTGIPSRGAADLVASYAFAVVIK